MGMLERSGVREHHLRLGVQLCLCFLIIMLLTAVTPVYNALDQRLCECVCLCGLWGRAGSLMMPERLPAPSCDA